MKRFWVGRSGLNGWAVLVLLACGGRTEPGFDDPGDDGVCVPGLQIECACPGGSSGVKLCRSDQRFGACGCDGATGSAMDQVGGGAASGVVPSDGRGNPVGSGSGGSGVYTGTGGYGNSGGSGGSRNSGGSGGTGAGGSSGAGGTYSAGGTFSTGGTASTGGTFSAGGTSSTGEPPEPAPTTFGTRPGSLIDAFPAPSGILVVESNAVVKLDRSGAELVRVNAERENTAAAFEGGRLVVADRAVFTVYDEDLGVIASGTLVESCASAVMVSGARFVCGPFNDWDRIFHTYDTSTGQRLASSSTYTYNGIPMRRVPGSDDFVTVTTDSSPSDFHLYSVLATGEAVYVSESPYHGDFSVTNVYAFHGDPASILLTSEGLMLEIYGEGCVQGEPGAYGTCFVRNGELGTLYGAEYFAGMDSANGVVYGLVFLSGPDFYAGAGPSTYALQQIDVATRRRLSERLYSFESGNVRLSRHDAASGSMLVGVTPSLYYTATPPDTYQLLLLSY